MKASKIHFYESSASYESDDEGCDKPSRRPVRVECKNLCVPVNGLPLCFSVSESERIAKLSIAWWAEGSGSVSSYARNSAVSRPDAGRKQFKAESWAHIIDLTVNERAWKDTALKKLIQATAFGMLALKVIRGFSMD